MNNENFKFELDSSNMRHPIILLGAGASKDLGMPICNELLSIEYINQFFLQDKYKEIAQKYIPANIGFEQLLTNALENNRQNEFEELLEYYEEIFLASENYVGSEKADDGKMFWEDRFCYYLDLATIIKNFSKKGLHPIIISFNHDLWLEHALYWNDFNYGTLTNSIDKSRNFSPSPSYGGKITILKLHGSFNFIACNQCGKMLCMADHIWPLADRIKHCFTCSSGKYKKVYIPPTTKKDYKMLNNSWDDAYYYMQNAAFLIAIGYSMPSYDKHAMELLLHLPRDATFYLVDKFAQLTTAKYSFLKNESRLFYSIGLRDFMSEALEIDRIPLHKFKYF